MTRRISKFILDNFYLYAYEEKIDRRKWDH